MVIIMKYLGYVLTVILWMQTGMNGAVRAVVRMGFYLGCKVFVIKEVSQLEPFWYTLNAGTLLVFLVKLDISFSW